MADRSLFYFLIIIVFNVIFTISCQSFILYEYIKVICTTFYKSEMIQIGEMELKLSLINEIIIWYKRSNLIFRFIDIHAKTKCHFHFSHEK